MRCNLCTWAMVCVLSVSAGLGTAGGRQSAAPDPRPEHVVKVTVDLIQVDVAVTDAKGRPVRDLRAEDFRVYENGSLRPIVCLRYVPEAGRPDAPGAEPAEPVGTAGSGVGGRATSVREPTHIVLVVDDLGSGSPASPTPAGCSGASWTSRCATAIGWRCCAPARTSGRSSRSPRTRNSFGRPLGGCDGTRSAGRASAGPWQPKSWRWYRF